MMDPPSLVSPEMWRFSIAPWTGGGGGGDPSGGAASILTEQSEENSRGRRTRKGASAAEGNESSKLASTSNGNDMTDCEAKRLKTNGGSKAEAKADSGVFIKPIEQNAQPSEAPKQDFIHVRARRGQATDSHSLAERARREKISERMKILQDLVPGCHKVIGKASILDEIINYIQALQHQVEFLSMKLEAVNSGISIGSGSFPPKDFGADI